MPTPTLNILDSKGGPFLTNLNTALQALGTFFYGAEDPATYGCAYPLMIWADTDPTHMKVWQRNLANTAWVQIGTIGNDGAFFIDSSRVTGIVSGSGSGSATVSIGTVETGDPGSNAKVTNSGTPTAAILDFVIPRGNNGITNSQVFVANGTFTAPAETLYVSGCGAGGGGSSIYGLGGGAAECYVRKTLSGLTVGEQIPITVGQPGLQAYNPGSTSLWPPSSVYSNQCGGADGGTTYIGKYLSMAGGKGAVVGPTTATAGTFGGPGGNPGELPVMVAFSQGSYTLRSGGKGGDCLLGIGGAGGQYAVSSVGAQVNGRNGVGFGAGGGGGSDYANYSNSTYTTTYAGIGAQGVVIFEW